MIHRSTALGHLEQLEHLGLGGEVGVGTFIAGWWDTGNVGFRVVKMAKIGQEWACGGGMQCREVC